MFRSFFCVIKFGGQHFFRNILLSLATIIIITLTLFSISSLVVFNMVTDNTLKVVQAKTDVLIDIKESTKQAEIDNLVASLKKIPNLIEVKYISADENLALFLEKNKKNNLVTEAVKTLGANPFKASLLIKVDKIENFPVVLNELSQAKYESLLDVQSENFTQTKTLVSKISDYSQKIKKAGLIISLIFIIIACLVVFNAIQISIHSRREEISIMRLVGASNFFIKGPFYIEGIIYSLFAMALLLIFIYPITIFIQPYIDSFFDEYTTNIVLQINANFLKIFGVEFVIAVLINITSASIAMKKYLKI